MTFMSTMLFPLYTCIFFIALILTALCEKRWIPVLGRKARQPIYEGGPSWHMKKNGTPTMGGLAFPVATCCVWLITSVYMFRSADRTGIVSFSLSVGFALLNALLGIIDDATKLRHKANAGLTPAEKLIFQTLFAVLFLLGRYALLGDTTELIFSIGKIDLGFLYYPSATILLVGFVNFANLTDGIDGLAGSVAFGIAVSLFYMASYVNVEVCAIAALLMGISIGFLLFNLHPAKIFMGDTGSLFLGALAVAACFSMKNPVLIIGVGAVYLLEGLSVVLQVVYFKLTKKRLFLMAPFHHHLEKLGWSENRICIVAILTTLVFSVPAYLLYAAR